MKISASFLDIKEPKNLEVTKLSKLDVDYIHLDVMDGIFVQNKTYTYEEFYNIIKDVVKPYDVHLMVSDVKKYIDDFSKLNPEFITFHYEAVSDANSVIKYIHDLGLKAGISIKPSTSITEIENILESVDLVLVMSVEPGMGGQKLLENSIDKIDKLYNIRKENNYKYLIEVDGGINDETIKKCKNADICVVGSYITKQDYIEAIKKLK